MATREWDQTAAEALILEHLPDVVTLCNRLFVQQSDADDAVHEAVLAVLRSLPTFRGDGPIRHWVLKVALNAARGHRRKLGRRSKREAPLVSDPISNEDASGAAGESEAREALRSALAALPDTLREPLVLHHFHRLKQVEIGRLLGCSQKTVSVRLRDGLAQLRRRLGGSSALSLMVAPVSASPVLDTVSPALTDSVRQCVAEHFAAVAATSATGVASPVAIGKTAAATGLVAGGLIMQMKLFAGGAVLAVACLFGGALLSDQLLGGGGESEDAAVVAELRSSLDTQAARLAEVERDLADERRDAAAARREAERQRRELGEKDRRIAALEDQAETSAAAAADESVAAEASREQRWAEIEKAIAPALEIMQKMQEEGANQFQLGPQMVAELGRLTPEQYAEIAAFDAEEKDPEIVGTIRSVMLQAFIFVPAAEPYRDDYMERYLARAQSEQFGDSFHYGVLSRISFSMPPFVDAYAKIVEPLGQGLQTDFTDMAITRIAAGNHGALQMDGARFLARSDDPRAAPELMRAFSHNSSSEQLRRVALKGLSNRADEEVLRFLRESERAEPEGAMKNELAKAVAQVEQRLVASQD